jgi:predicted lactoylglutathione lyase
MIVRMLLEEEIYRRFMSRQLEDTDGNQAVPKITIEKRQLPFSNFIQLN